MPLVRDFFALWRRDKEAERRSSKASAPPLPEHTPANTRSSALPPAAVQTATGRSPNINHLADFLHTSPSSAAAPKSPKPASRLSYAPPPRNTGSTRPHTANPGETASSHQNSISRPLISHPFNANYEEQTRRPPAFTGGSSRPGRSSTVPNGEHHSFGGGGGRLEAISDTEPPRAKEPLLLRTIRDNNGIHRAPGRQVSTPELPRSDRLPLERRSSRDLLLTRNTNAVDPRVAGMGGMGVPGTGNGNGVGTANLAPMPVFIRTVSQPGGVRRAALRETAGVDEDEEEGGGLKPARTFPFDHPPDSPPITPITPGVAGVGVGRTGGRHIESLAVLDPEMYQTLAAQHQQAPWTLPTPTAAATLDTSASASQQQQALPRARKTPPIIDSGNRSARFFVDDPTTGMVDVAGGPPPRSPISAPMGMEMSHDAAAMGQFEQVAAMRQFQGTKLAKPPSGRAPPPTKPPLDMSDHGHNYSFSTTYSGASVPGFSSPNATSSISSHGSPLSTTNAAQRYRSRGSLGSVAEQRRLSLDSLVASDFELPYLSRNISTPHFTQKNKSSDAVFVTLNALNAPPNPISQRGRGSYSSQETDSTGFGLEDNLASFAGHTPTRLPPSKAAVVAPKTTPPPRPPRSALRNSSQFSAGIIHRLNESLAANQLQNDLTMMDSHDFIDSYFTASTPQLPHATLEPPTPTYTRDGRESNVSSLTNFAQYYQNEKHQSMQATEAEYSIASLPPTPLTTAFDTQTPNVSSFRTPPHNAVSPNVGVVAIKAVHAQSETIVLLKISRYETSLSDLRSKIVRKFRETEGLDLAVNGFSLKYLPPRTDHGFISTPAAGGRKRSTSVTSTSDVSILVSLESEMDWQRALAGNSKIVIRII